MASPVSKLTPSRPPPGGAAGVGGMTAVGGMAGPAAAVALGGPSERFYSIS